MDSINTSFGQYLHKTDNTQKISDWVSANSASRRDALINVTRIAYEYNEYQSDLETYGVLEKFAHPDEVLYKGAGDCDCKSGLIVAILDGLVPNLRPDEARVTVGRYLNFPPKPNEYHAWSEVRYGDDWYILDGTSGKVLSAPNPKYFRVFSIYQDKVTMADPLFESVRVGVGIPIVPFIDLIDAIGR